MAADKKVVSDLGSEELKLVRLQLNRLTAAVEALRAEVAANANYTDFQTDVAALTEFDDFENILSSLELPLAPALDEG